MDLSSYIKRFGIGLTGGIATGKSTVSRILREEGCTVFDADTLARQAVLPGSQTLARLVELTGADILAADGSLDRKKLAARIFAQPPLRQQVEAVIHTRIWQLLEAELRPLWETRTGSYWFFDAALLFETGSHRRFAQVWLTSCPPAVQRQRLIARDHLTPLEADRIMASQFPADRKRQLADHTIDTARPIEAVRRSVKALLRELPEHKHSSSD